MSIPLNCTRAAFEAFEARVETAALNRYLDSLEPDWASIEQAEEDEAAYEALLDFEAGERLLAEVSA